MATSPNYGWLEPDNTDLVKNGALAIRTLGNAIDSTMATMVPKSIVDAKGDLIAGTAADTPARLAVGNNGETLVADSSTSTGLRYQEPKAANPILNSSFQVWQRGTSISLAASTLAYTADRWIVNTPAGCASTISRQATGDSTNLPFIQYCARVQRNSGQTGAGYLDFTQMFETLNTVPFAGKTVTLSFYARRGANYSATSNLLTVRGFTGTGTDQSLYSAYTGSAQPLDSSATLTTTWQRFTFTFAIASTATEMSYVFTNQTTGTAGAADFFEITGVQLDIGSVALPFRTYAGTIQGELAACQRYYYAAENLQTFSAYSVSTSYLISNVRYPVTMRTTPSISIGSNSGLNYVRVISSAAQQALTVSSYPGTGQTGFSGVYAAAAPFTANIGYDFYITASAEL